MTARAFVDTNIVVYAESADGDKTGRAVQIVESLPVISTQVVNETISVLTRRHEFSLAEAYEVAESLLELCEVVPVEAATIREAIRVAGRYRLSHWDSLIVAAALLSDCDTLYTEDLQHEQVFENRLKVINPFLGT